MRRDVKINVMLYQVRAHNSWKDISKNVGPLSAMQTTLLQVVSMETTLLQVVSMSSLSSSAVIVVLVFCRPIPMVLSAAVSRSNEMSQALEN